MNNNQNGWMSPFMYNNNQVPMQMPYQMAAPRYDIVKVKGEAGAKNFKMAPNSQAILADETAPMIWIAQTDGTGYLTVTPYDIAPHQQAPQIDLNDLHERVKKLEENYVQQSNTTAASKQRKQQRPQQSNESANAAD